MQGFHPPDNINSYNIRETHAKWSLDVHICAYWIHDYILCENTIVTFNETNSLSQIWMNYFSILNYQVFVLIHFTKYKKMACFIFSLNF